MYVLPTTPAVPIAVRHGTNARTMPAAITHAIPMTHALPTTTVYQAITVQASIRIVARSIGITVVAVVMRVVT